jgi:hypothetical protein
MKGREAHGFAQFFAVDRAKPIERRGGFLSAE